MEQKTKLHFAVKTLFSQEFRDERSYSNINGTFTEIIDDYLTAYIFFRSRNCMRVHFNIRTTQDEEVHLFPIKSEAVATATIRKMLKKENLIFCLFDTGTLELFIQGERSLDSAVLVEEKGGGLYDFLLDDQANMIILLLADNAKICKLDKQGGFTLSLLNETPLDRSRPPGSVFVSPCSKYLFTLSAVEKMNKAAAVSLNPNLNLQTAKTYTFSKLQIKATECMIELSFDFYLQNQITFLAISKERKSFAVIDKEMNLYSIIAFQTDCKKIFSGKMSKKSDKFALTWLDSYDLLMVYTLDSNEVHFFDCSLSLIFLISDSKILPSFKFEPGGRLGLGHVQSISSAENLCFTLFKEQMIKIYCVSEYNKEELIIPFRGNQILEHHLLNSQLWIMKTWLDIQMSEGKLVSRLFAFESVLVRNYESLVTRLEELFTYVEPFLVELKQASQTDEKTKACQGSVFRIGMILLGGKQLDVVYDIGKQAGNMMVLQSLLNFAIAEEFQMLVKKVKNTLATLASTKSSQKSDEKALAFSEDKLTLEEINESMSKLRKELLNQ